MGVVANGPAPEPVVIHERDSFNWWAVAAVLVLLAFLGLTVYQRRNQPSTTVVAEAQDIPSKKLIRPAPSIISAGAEPQVLNGETIYATDNEPVSPAGPAPVPPSEIDPLDQADINDFEGLPPAINQQVQEGNEPEPTGAAVMLADAQVASQDDGEGRELAVGMVTVVNNSPYDISNFSLTLATPDGNYRLRPFTGSFENPIDITDRRIPPGGYMQVPVMSDGLYLNSDPGSPVSVSVEATENGLIATDQTTIN